MKNKNDNLNELGKTFKEVGPYLSIGVQLAATIILMVLIGSWLDDRYDKDYLFTIIFAILGILSGMYNLFRTLNNLEKRKKIKNNE